MNYQSGGIKRITALLLAGAISAAAFAAESKERTIVFNEDRNQHYMTTKTYELRHVRAHDILPFIKGAIKRFDDQSTIQSLDYAAGKKQYLVVSTGSQLLPYIDDMIAKLDYPSPKIDENGSAIEGDGVTRFVYCGKYRTSENMNHVVSQTFIDGFGSGASYFDVGSNMFYWKSSKSQGEAYLKFLTALDRPLPQLQVQLNIYVISDNNFRELGIDYLAWKNGPGAEIFATGFDFSNFYSVEHLQDFTNILSSGPIWDATGLGGILVAPNFDATFLRMLAQKGKAWTAASAMLTLTNDFTTPAATSWEDASYRFKFTPQLQNIVKDENQTTSLDALDGSEFSFYLSSPVICFGDDPAKKALTLMCNWNLEVNSLVETDNQGVATIDSNSFSSNLTLEAGAEKLLAVYDKHVVTEQYNGMPFLGEIPVLKYLFGAESKVDSKMRVFVTMSAVPVETKNIPNPAAGKVIEAAELAAANKTGF